MVTSPYSGHARPEQQKQQRLPVGVVDTENARSANHRNCLTVGKTSLLFTMATATYRQKLTKVDEPENGKREGTYRGRRKEDKTPVFTACPEGR